ncbi:MAG: type II secretion system F family protein [Bacteroidales bacterium]|nr:type II secretion system F family protein [Bacteroidales bacterium]MBN2817643.1 type II secretion system F family protein [Bacteroidales bacterium]
MAIKIKDIQKKSHDVSKTTKNRNLLDFLNKDISLKRSGLSDKKKERFYGELSILVNSGIDLASSLQIIIDQEKNSTTLKIYENLLNELIRGSSFSNAMRSNRVFSEYEFYNIRIGEESGTIAVALDELAKHYKTKMKQRRQLISALSYPILVIIVAVAAVVFMLNVVVPMFAGVFQRFGGELPGITTTILKISDFLKNNVILILLILIGVFLLSKYAKRFEWYRKFATDILLKTPIFGNLFLKINLSRFCSSLYLLESSGAPLIDALDLANKMIRFYPLNKAIEGTSEKISVGGSMHESMKKYKIFDAQIISLIKVGEETGKLEYILKQLHEQYSEEIEHRTKQLGSLLEPLLILGVGLMVMVILIAMYLPLFKLSTSII